MPTHVASPFQAYFRVYCPSSRRDSHNHFPTYPTAQSSSSPPRTLPRAVSTIKLFLTASPGLDTCSSGSRALSINGLLSKDSMTSSQLRYAQLRMTYLRQPRSQDMEPGDFSLSSTLFSFAYAINLSSRLVVPHIAASPHSSHRSLMALPNKSSPASPTCDYGIISN
jgi:hypothetical protein